MHKHDLILVENCFSFFENVLETETPLQNPARHAMTPNKNEPRKKHTVKNDMLKL